MLVWLWEMSDFQFRECRPWLCEKYVWGKSWLHSQESLSELASCSYCKWERRDLGSPNPPPSSCDSLRPSQSPAAEKWGFVSCCADIRAEHTVHSWSVALKSGVRQTHQAEQKWRLRYALCRQNNIMKPTEAGPTFKVRTNLKWRLRGKSGVQKVFSWVYQTQTHIWWETKVILDWFQQRTLKAFHFPLHLLLSDWRQRAAQTTLTPVLINSNQSQSLLIKSTSFFFITELHKSWFHCLSSTIRDAGKKQLQCQINIINWMIRSPDLAHSLNSTHSRTLFSKSESEILYKSQGEIWYYCFSLHSTAVGSKIA